MKTNLFTIDASIRVSPGSRGAEGSAVLRRMRARRADREGGAVLFVTAMTLAVLASLGLYALSTARAEVRSSGYETRMAMTDGLAQWAFAAEIAHLNIDAGDVASALVTTTPNNSRYSTASAFNACIALDNVPSTETQLTKNCIVNPMASYTTNAGAIAMWSPAGRSYNATPDFFIELTNADEPPQTVKGTDLHGVSKYKLVTISTYAILHLTNSGGLQTTLDIVRQGRGHLIAGPINGS